MKMLELHLTHTIKVCYRYFLGVPIPVNIPFPVQAFSACQLYLVPLLIFHVNREYGYRSAFIVKLNKCNSNVPLSTAAGRLQDFVCGRDS